MKKFKSLAWVALYMVLAFALQFVVSVVLAVCLFDINGFGLYRGEGAMEIARKVTEIVSQGAFVIAITAMCDLIMLAGFGLWYYFRESKYSFRPDYKRAFSLENIVIILVLAVCGQFAVELLMAGIATAFPWMMESYEKINNMFQLDTLSPVLMVLIICFLGPVAEEMVFRGMIYGKLRRAFSVWPSAIISGILFGIFHGNWVQGIYATFIGIILAIIYEETTTIWGSCLFHILFNSSSYLLEIPLKWLNELDSPVMNGIRLLVDLISVGVVIFLTRYMSVKRRYAK